MIITITAIFLIALVGLIIWAEIKGYDIDLAVIDGFFIGGLYDKDENETQYLHTIQIIFVVLSVSILWETDK
jgi:hypothetical protein